MKVVAWVPIKMNNERLPGKNTLPLAGKPLCQHVLGELLQMQEVEGVYAFCSEAELDQYLPEGVERIPRDTSLNSFSTKINDVILAFSKAVDADVYVYAQVTSPFLKKDAIEQGLNAVLSGEYDSALSVKVLRDFLWQNGKPVNYDPADIARTQDLDAYFQETGGFYIYTKDLIQKYNRRTGFHPYFVEIPEIEAVDIDYREDYELAQSIVLKDFGRQNDNYNISMLIKWLSFCERGDDINDMMELLGYCTCAIYGAGLLGRMLYDRLDKDLVKPMYFIDGKALSCRDIRCVKPQEIPEEEKVDIIIITPGYDEQQIKKSLEGVVIPRILLQDLLEINWRYYNPEISLEKIKITGKEGYKRLYDDYAISEKCWGEAWNEIIHWMIRLNLQNNSSEEIKEYTFKAAQMLFQKKVVLPLIDLVITTRCTFKCKKCFHLIPSYTKEGRNPFDVELEIIKRDLNKILSAVDYVVKINLLGGEPFLFKRLGELLNYCKECDKVGYFCIVSNGSIVPDDEVCRILADKKFIVHINDYGILEGRVEEIVAKLEKYGVKVQVGNDRVWYDFGNLEKANYTLQELEEHYAKCGYSKCKALMEGELHSCAFLKHGQRNGLIPDFRDSLHIHQYADDELRGKIIEFFQTKYFQGCEYCSAPIREKSPMIPAGEQE